MSPCRPSIYKFGLSWCLFVCLFVCLYPINVKTAEPIGPYFLWDITWPQGRFMDDQIFKNLPQSKFDFWKFWKYTTFFFIKSANFFSQWKGKMGAKRLASLVIYNLRRPVIKIKSWALARLSPKHCLFPILNGIKCSFFLK